MGFAWLIFRIKYYFKLKNSFFKKNDYKFLKKIENMNINKIPKWLNIFSNTIPSKSKHIDIADNAINGKIFIFSNEYLEFNNPKKWHYNPIEKIEITNKIHWSKLPDFGTLGDIKIPWELSRFPHFYSYIKAHKITQDEIYINAFIEDLESWLKENNFPNGINYKCGQEMTFRMFSILISINYFYEYLDNNFFNKISKYLLISGYRIEENIDYAVVSVRNDHAISESIGLIILGLLFQDKSNDAQRWFRLGKKILLNELDKQVYTDGSYLCHSFNYQREVLDELTFLLLILKNNFYDEKELIDKLIDKNKKMVIFLNSFIQNNGWLPNYGSNDGANLFPVSESDYRDYRTSLNFALSICSNKTIFKNNIELLELFSIKLEENKTLKKEIKFDNGGYFILKNENIFSFLRCHSYQDRPSQNDMLHLDIWYKEKNIFCDAGTYSYNTDKIFQNNFQGVLGHNTIMINNENQMQQVLNFGWSNWTKSKLLKSSGTFFNGEHYGYAKKYGVTCNRQVTLKNNKIVTIDTISNIKEEVNIKQLWNTKEKVTIIDDYTVEIKNCIVTSSHPIKLEKSYISDYYNNYNDGTKLIIELDSNSNVKIKTIMEFKS
jgi:hypothetical protein